MWLVLFIIGGIVLNNNPDMFKGAETVGDVLLAFGVIGLVFWLFVLIAAALGSGR
jgi:hypothetical protein